MGIIQSYCIVLHWCMLSSLTVVLSLVLHEFAVACSMLEFACFYMKAVNTFTDLVRVIFSFIYLFV